MVGKKGGREKETAREKQRQIRDYQRHTSALVSFGCPRVVGLLAVSGDTRAARAKQRQIRGCQRHTSETLGAGWTKHDVDSNALRPPRRHCCRRRAVCALRQPPARASSHWLSASPLTW